jgi:preprotein translocase subunit SecG
MIFIALTILHVIICLFLWIVILLQSGKAADLAGAFGGMGSQTAFGPRGAATVLSKATTAAAALFMLTSLTLSVLESRGGRSGGGGTVLDKAPVTAPKAPPQKGIQVVPGAQTPPAQTPPAPVEQPPAKK